VASVLSKIITWSSRSARQVTIYSWGSSPPARVRRQVYTAAGGVWTSVRRLV